MHSQSTDNFLLKISSRSPGVRLKGGRRARKSPQMHTSSLTSFRSSVWRYWKKNGRHDLPWRLPTLKLRQGKKDFDPYHILVSEVMLQQTQVDRVVPKYQEFLKAFPNVRMLAKASLSDVLKIWSGLGYNRRGKYLRDAAAEIIARYRGKVPKEYNALRSLPGVGDYTARALRVFAFNEPDILTETNIRTALIHCFATSSIRSYRTGLRKVADRDIFPIAARTAEGQMPREWYWALMDYGAHLKRLGVRNNHKSVHYIKQPKFEGSLRQLRGAILRTLTRGQMIEIRSQSLSKALEGLVKDGLIRKYNGRWKIA